MSDRMPANVDTPLAVTLTVAQWRMVLEQLSAPYRAIAPLIGSIEMQCNAQIQRDMPAPMMRGNGTAMEERVPDV